MTVQEGCCTLIEMNENNLLVFAKPKYKFTALLFIQFYTQAN